MGARPMRQHAAATAPRVVREQAAVSVKDRPRGGYRPEAGPVLRRRHRGQRPPWWDLTCRGGLLKHPEHGLGVGSGAAAASTADGRLRCPGGDDSYHPLAPTT
jgi:hypothetical protein